MSNSSLTADAIEGSIIANYVSFSTSALYIYEYLIVIDQEIALVWKAKWKLSTLLFLVNRYVALMVALVYTVPVVDYTTQASCNAGVNLLKTATLVQFLVIAVFSTQRVFAVTSRTEYKYWLSALVFALGIVPIIVNVWTVAQEKLIYVPKSACTSFVVGYDEVLLRLAFATRASAILADILVIIFIIRHNWAFYVKTKGIQLMGNTNLCQTMLFDGTIYFLAMLIINVFFALDNTLPYFKGLPPVISMVQSIPPILTSRMLLHLREAADARAGPLNDSNDHWATAPLQFADPASGRCKVTKDIVDLSEKDMESIEFENVTMEDGTPESREVDTDEQAISEVPRSESRC